MIRRTSKTISIAMLIGLGLISTTIAIAAPASISNGLGRAGSPLHHDVQEGETLWGIADMYGVGVSEVRRWNSLRRNLVHPGKALRLWPRGKVVRASWYGSRFRGRLMANGERFDPRNHVVAHKRLPLGTWVEIRYRGRRIFVPVKDRGPYIRGRELDLSQGAAQTLGFVKAGVVPVTYRVVAVP